VRFKRESNEKTSSRAIYPLRRKLSIKNKNEIIDIPEVYFCYDTQNLNNVKIYTYKYIPAIFVYFILSISSQEFNNNRHSLITLLQKYKSIPPPSHSMKPS